MAKERYKATTLDSFFGNFLYEQKVPVYPIQCKSFPGAFFPLKLG